MNEEDLYLIAALNKYKNITKTAAKMNLSQPAVTRRIKALEEDFGAELLIRSRNGVIFTPLAEEILPKIMELSKGFEEVREYFSIHSEKVCGRLKVGVSINYAQYRMGEAMADFSSHFPDVTIEIESTQSQTIFKRLQDHSLSLAVVRGKFPWDSGEILFHQEPVYLIAKSPCTIAELNQLNYLQRDSETGFSSRLKQWFEENHLKPKHHIYIDNITATISLVEKGLGWAIVPEACLDHFQGYKQPIILKNGEAFQRNSYLLFREEYIRLPQVRHFCESILKHGNVPSALAAFQSLYSSP